MLYRVVVDGTDILDYTDPELVLLNPKLELEVNAAGNLEFALPPYHKYYDLPKILMSTVEVYEDDQMIWFGRPVEQVIDFYKQKRIYCEGPLSFFNDSVQMRAEYDSIQLSSYFRSIINTHNVEVVNKDRCFEVGLITINDSSVYRKFEYESTYDVLKGTCLDTVDGYFFFRRENGTNYIDWVKDIPYSSNQPIQFGFNLLDYQSDFDATEFVTCVFPLGKDQGNNQGPLTVADVNNGQPVLESEAINTYGRIVKFQSWSDINDPYELLSEGRKFLENTQFNSLTIECNAADLHSFNKEYDLFKLGQNVHCISSPHLIDRDFPISKISIQLDSAAKQITLGTIKRKTLTRIYKEDTDTTSGQDDSGGGDYDPGIIPGSDGDPWEIIMPTDPGGPVTAIPLPTKITIFRAPNKLQYNPGEEIDFTGLQVKAWVTNSSKHIDEAWNNPPTYVNGLIPFSELKFPTHIAPNTKNFTVTVLWPYKGKTFYADIPMMTEDEQLNPAPLQRPIPASPTGYAIFGGRQDYSFTSGSGLITQWLCTERTCGFLAASSMPNTSVSCRGNLYWTASLSKSFTYDGKTVYYYYFAQGGVWPGTFQSMSPRCNPGSYVNGVTEHAAASAAWIMIYGG